MYLRRVSQRAGEARRLGRVLSLVLAAALGATAASAAPDGADGERAEPLSVPRGPGILPEEAADLSARERVDLAARSLAERGHRELPVLAWALLSSEANGANGAVERALELAPRTPSVRFEAARRLRSPAELVQAVGALARSFPGLLWLATAGGAALGAGLLGAAALVILLAFGRTLSLHGHSLGHRRIAQDPPSWPGALLVLGGLALVPLAGVGPALLLGAAGALAAMRLDLRPALALAGALALSGAILGPGADGWARLASRLGADSNALAVWRVERGQALPGDRARLEAAHAADRDDMLVRVGLAASYKREGDLDGALGVLRSLPATGAPELHARAFNLVGILHLARGDVEKALRAFEDARSVEESAAVLYNLSQAYARGMRLLERSAPFSAARDLDPELVSRFTAFEGANVHEFLIEPPLPLRPYVARALDPAPDAAALAREIRLWTLGPGLPDWGWLLLPALGLVAVAARRSTIGRCGRCERAVCDRCVPDGAAARTCVRCAKLFARGAQSDPRMRRRQMELDRLRLRRLALGRAVVALAIPGAARVLDGRLIVGSLAALVAATGAALWLAAAWVPSPFEVGASGPALATGLAVVLLLAAYGFALLETRRELSALGGRP